MWHNVGWSRQHRNKSVTVHVCGEGGATTCGAACASTQVQLGGCWATWGIKRREISASSIFFPGHLLLRCRVRGVAASPVELAARSCSALSEGLLKISPVRFALWLVEHYCPFSDMLKRVIREQCPASFPDLIYWQIYGFRTLKLNGVESLTIVLRSDDFSRRFRVRRISQAKNELYGYHSSGDFFPGSSW